MISLSDEKGANLWNLIEVLEEKDYEFGVYGDTYYMRKEKDRELTRKILGRNNWVASSLDNKINYLLNSQRSFDLVISDEEMYVLTDEAENDIEQLNNSLEIENLEYINAEAIV
jgi:hypothetical protein